MRTSLILFLVASIAGCSPAYDFAVAHSPEQSQARDVIALQTGNASPVTTFPVQPQPDVDGPQSAAMKGSHAGGPSFGHGAAMGALAGSGSVGVVAVIVIAMAVASSGKK